MDTAPLAYVPSIFSIYLILINPLARRVLESSIHGYLQGKPDLQKHELVIVTIADDWAERLSFINSLLAAIISVLVLFAETQNYLWLVLSAVILLAVFVAVLLWIMGTPPGMLAGAYLPPPFSITRAQLTQLVIIVANVVVMAAIYASQQPVTPP